jgi:hypothetical protein
MRFAQAKDIVEVKSPQLEIISAYQQALCSANDVELTCNRPANDASINTAINTTINR